MRNNDPCNLPAASSNLLTSFFQGAALPFRGASYLMQHPSLWLMVIIPLVINIILFVLFLVFGASFFSSWLEGLLQTPPEEAAWYIRWGIGAVKVLIQIFFWLIVLLLVYFTFTPLALIIACPFNDRIAENAERACGFMVEDKRGIMKMVAVEAVFAVLSELKRIIVFTGILLLLLPLNLIPGFGSLGYAILAFVWSCFGLSFEFSSYAADRRHFGFRTKYGLLREHIGLTLGFGTATFLLFMIPLVNVLVVPVSAVAGTFLFCMARRASGDSGDPIYME